MRQMRTYMIVIFLLLFSRIQLYAQKEGNIWYMPYNAGITFNTSPPSALSNNQWKDWWVSTMCDNTGHLQFLVTYDTVWDRNRNIMLNGTGLKLPANAAETICLPSPQDTGLYYILYSDENSDTLLYSTVDMHKNGGLGAVTQKDVLLNLHCDWNVNATQHANKKDIWILTHGTYSDSFFAYPLTAAGIGNPVVSTTWLNYNNTFVTDVEGIKVSPAGNCVAILGYYINNNPQKIVQLCHFDNSTGQAKSWFYIPLQGDDIENNGIEFSPDGSKLYVSFLDSLKQYDLSSGDSLTIIRSGRQIHNITKPDPIFLRPMLGPDGRIYEAEADSFLGVIENPNAPADKVIYNAKGVDLLGKSTYWFLPLQPFFNHIPKAGASFSYNCFGDSVFFSGTSTLNPAAYFWDFGDTASHANDTSSKQNPVHYYARPGTYTVKLVADVNGFKDTATQTLTIKVSAFSLGPDTTLCTGQSYPLSAAMPSVRYLWSTGDTTASVQAKATGTYWVKAYTSTCARYDTVKLKFVDVKTDLGKDTSICRDGSVTLDAGTDSVSYIWSTGETTRTIQAAKAGTYRVTVKRAACTASDSITIMQAPEPSKVIPGTLYLCPDWKETQSVDAGIAKSYLWQPGGYRGQVFTAQDTGQYTLVTTNGYGCTHTDTFHVIRQCPPSLQVPNAFTPNQDSLNQTFIPVGLDIETFEMYVYDRWGEMIYYTTSFDKGWDGTFKGNSCPEGLYFYKLKCTGYGRPEKTIIRRTGTFYLMR